VIEKSNIVLWYRKENEKQLTGVLRQISSEDNFEVVHMSGCPGTQT
jgi:hypothetical protein